MKRIQAFVFAAALTASCAASAAAGDRHREQHHSRHGHHFTYQPSGGAYFYRYERPRFGQPVFGWRAHVRWCRSRYASYIHTTNRYMDSWGKRRRCNSPFD